MKARDYENHNSQATFFQVITEQLLRVYQLAPSTVRGCLLDQGEVGKEGFKDS